MRTGFNGLEVNHQMVEELLTEMAAEGFVVPEEDPNAADAAQAEDGEENDN